MSISDAEFDAWAVADHPRCLLVEAKVWHAGAEITRYFSTWPYVSAPTDTPAHQPYDEIVIDWTIRRSSNQPLEVGPIRIANPDGALDAWLADGWDGRAVTILLGDPAWSRADFRVWHTGVIAGIAAAGAALLEIEVRDLMERLNRPVQTHLLKDGPNVGQPAPLVYGMVRNIAPPVVDQANLIYQVHDGAGPVAAPQVRDRGWPATVTWDQATSTFTLAAAPDGLITCDPYPSDDRTPGAITPLLATRENILSLSDIDTAALTAMDAAIAADLNIYQAWSGIAILDRRNLIDVLRELWDSWGCSLSWTRAGKLTVWRWVDPETLTASMSFGVDDIAENSLVPVGQTAPLASVRLGSSRNYTVQDQSSLAGAVPLEDKQYYSGEWKQGYSHGGISEGRPCTLIPMTGTFQAGFTYCVFNVVGHSIETGDVISIVDFSQPWSGVYSTATKIDADHFSIPTNSFMSFPYTGPFVVAKATPVPAHLGAENPDFVGTAIAFRTFANAEANRRANLFSTVRRTYRAEIFGFRRTLALGQAVDITYPRFGFEAGAQALVVGIDENIGAGRTVIEVWR
jgi:hypothetical protein